MLTDNKDFLRGVEVERRMNRILIVIEGIVRNSGLSQRALAKQMGVSSPATIQRVLHSGAGHNARMETLMRLALACGYEMDVQFRKLRR